MGRVVCPICETLRHIDDTGEVDRCWVCGWVVPVNRETGEYLPSSDWPLVAEQERRDRKRHAAKVIGR